MEKILYVKWNDRESSSFYVDKDNYSRAHEYKTFIKLDTYSGTYKFYKNRNKVTFDNGVEVRNAKVLDWEIQLIEVE